MGAARFLNVPHEASQHGMPHTTGSVEREARDMVSRTRTLLVAVGSPRYDWSYVAPCYVHLDNCLPHPSGKPSAWHRRYGEELRGNMTPFGVAVICKPSLAKGKVDKPLPSAL